MKRLFMFLFALMCWSGSVFSQQLDRIQGDVLLQLEPNANIEEVVAGLQQFEGLPTRFSTVELLAPPFRIWQLHLDYVTIHEGRFLEQVRRHPGVAVAQFNHLITMRQTTPNDPLLQDQWQWVNLGLGSALDDADVDADLAWDITTGGSTADGHDIVVCVVEGGGANINHPDLANNIWYNLNEIPDNGLDDDENGYVDDYAGWNVASDTDNIPAGNHGTAVSGMIGAVGDNSLGITGINWRIKIMEVVLQGVSESSVIEAYTYPYVQRKRFNETNGQEGAFVVAVNSSWGIDGGDPEDAPLWCAFYDTLGVQGILSCGATANVNWNIDEVGDLPTACPSEYQVSVTATNNQDLRTFSAYGVEHVDVAAPGGGVFTLTTNSYNSTSGTSFASPLTAGVIALLYSAPCAGLGNQAIADPAGTALQIRDYLFAGIDTVPGLVGFIKTGGRINAFNSLQLLLPNCGPCPKPYNVSVSEILDIQADISWAVGDSTLATDLRLREVGSLEWDTLYGLSSPYLLSGLEACRTYELEFLAVCAEENSGFGQTIQFDTDGCCSVPPDLVLAEVGEFTAAFEWTSIFAAESYLVQFRETGAAQWESLEVMSNALVLDVEPCKQYEFRLESACVGDSTSGYSDILSFTTECNCLTPTNPDTVEVSLVDARLIWDEMNYASGYKVQYRKLTVPSWTTVEVDTNFFELEGLEPCTDYRFTVKTLCSIEESNFTAALNFRTACEPVVSALNDLSTGSLTLYPNPFRETVWLGVPQTGMAEVTLFDAKGEMVERVERMVAEGQAIPVGGGLPAGLYWVRVRLDGQVWTTKVVKE